MVEQNGQEGLFVTFITEAAPRFRLQALDANGDRPAGWPVNGLLLSPTSATELSELFVDYTGYATVAWSEKRGATFDIYATRIGPDGQVAKGWPPGSVSVCEAPYEQWQPHIASDSAGGSYISWIDGRDGYYRTYLQHLTIKGQPAPGWPANGKPASARLSGHQWPRVAADGRGGALCVWEDYRTTYPRAFAQRFSADGTMLWPDTGVAACSALWSQSVPQIAADGHGGAYVTWLDYQAGGFALIQSQRIDSTGQRLWGEGFEVAPSRGPEGRHMLLVDGTPGFRVTWEDDRIDRWNSDIYAQSVTESGTVAPGWPTGGLEVGSGPWNQADHEACSDGAGGLFAAWVDWRVDGGRGDIVAQHILASGEVAPGWPDSGLFVRAGNWSQDNPSITTDGRGGALVAWEDGGGAWVCAARVSAEGVVPALVSLIEAEATPTRVRIAWSVSLPGGTSVGLERRDGEGEWERVAIALVAGDGAVRYEDTSVVAGRRYGYRLVISGSGPLGETWVEVPAQSGFGVGSAWLERGGGRLHVRFTLAARGAAEVEVFDVAGRRLAARTLASPEPGEHTVALEVGRGLPSGVGFVRVRQGTATASRKAVVFR